MRRLLITLYAIIIAQFLVSVAFAATIQLPKTGQTTCYSGTEYFQSISCTGTGQDGELQTGLAWPNPRFTDNGDQTITDNLTGLIWTKDANMMKTHNPIVDAAGIPIDKGVNWQQALDYVKRLNTENYLGHSDWRLPNINELKSLLLNGRNDLGFINIQSNSQYWSSSTYTNYPFCALAIYTSGSMYYSGKTNNNYIWPVRGGQLGGIYGFLTLPKTGQTTCYDTSGTTIPCSGTGQDGELQMGVDWPIPRFADNSIVDSNDKTITDNLTSLIWAKDANLPSANKTWQEALDYIKSLNSVNYLGHNDWRLPNINELASLVNTGKGLQYTWLNQQGFLNVQSNNSNYWSSSNSAMQASCVYMLSGEVQGCSKNYSIVYVWPVRGGQPDTSIFFKLTVAKSGAGSGAVTSPTIGISCGSNCTTDISTGASITLFATPDSGSIFTGWTGSCSGTSTCTVMMDAAKSVTASFTLSATNGNCGSANGTTVIIVPTTNLCSTGSPSTITGTGPWSWNCTGSNGGSTATCSANIVTWTTNFGSSGNGSVSCTTPVNNGATSTCTVTSASGYQLSTFTDNGVDKKSYISGNSYSITNVTTNHTITATFSQITCPIGQQLVGSTCQTIICATGTQLVGNTCQAITCPSGQILVGNACQPTPVNGVCGTSNGSILTAAPSTNLCATGTASTVTTGSVTWNWTCASINGGTTASCYASFNSISPGGTTKAKLFMGTGGDVVTVSNSGMAVYGNTGYDVVTIADGVYGVTLDQNIERINFTTELSNYKFKQTGNIINVFSALGTLLIITAPVQDDNDGTLLSFSNGTASVKITTGGTMTLGGAIVTSGSMPATISLFTTTTTTTTTSTPTTSTTTTSTTTTTLTASQENISLSNANGNGIAVNNRTYNVTADSYTYTLNGFSAGNKLVCTGGTNPYWSVANTSGTDGILIVSCSVTYGTTTKTAQINLTGINTTMDAQVYNRASFKTTFGADSLTP